MPKRKPRTLFQKSFRRKLFGRGKGHLKNIFPVGYEGMRNLLINILEKRMKAKRKLASTQLKTQLKTNITRLKKLQPKTTIGAAARPRRGLTERGKFAAEQVKLYKSRGWIKISRGTSLSGKKLPGINIMSGRKWRGPPGALGDDVIVEILPTVEMAIEAGRPGTLKSMNVKVDWTVVWNAVNDFYTELVRWLKVRIGPPHPQQAEGIVPTDTGTLRRKMWQSLERQWYSKTKMPMTPTKMKQAAEAGNPLLIVVLNTGNLMYAKPVNQMPTSMLAHPHKFTKRGKGGIPVTIYNRYGRGGALFDPKAMGGWYDAIKQGGRQEARSLTTNLRARAGQKLLEIHYS